jgi:hypothetical protein
LAAVLAALHESRSREAARFVRRNHHLIKPSPDPALASATRRLRARRPEDALKPALIATVIGFVLIHGITLGVLGAHASSDPAIVLRGD